MAIKNVSKAKTYSTKTVGQVIATSNEDTATPKAAPLPGSDGKG